MSEQQQEIRQSVQTSKLATKKFFMSREEAGKALEYLSALLPIPTTAVDRYKKQVEHVDQKYRDDARKHFLKFKTAVDKYNNCIKKSIDLLERHGLRSGSIFSDLKQSSPMWTISVKQLLSSLKKARTELIKVVSNLFPKEWDKNKTMMYLTLVKGKSPILQHGQKRIPIYKPIIDPKTKFTKYSLVSIDEFINNLLPYDKYNFYPAFKSSPYVKENYDNKLAYRKIVGSPYKQEQIPWLVYE